jgi:hypothetical protein
MDRRPLPIPCALHLRESGLGYAFIKRLPATRPRMISPKSGSLKVACAMVLLLLGMPGAAAAQTNLPFVDQPSAEESFGARIDATRPIVVERSVYSNANGVTWAAGTNATAIPLP